MFSLPTEVYVVAGIIAVAGIVFGVIFNMGKRKGKAEGKKKHFETVAKDHEAEIETGKASVRNVVDEAVENTPAEPAQLAKETNSWAAKLKRKIQNK